MESEPRYPILLCIFQRPWDFAEKISQARLRGYVGCFVAHICIFKGGGSLLHWEVVNKINIGVGGGRHMQEAHPIHVQKSDFGA